MNHSFMITHTSLVKAEPSQHNNVTAELLTDLLISTANLGASLAIASLPKIYLPPHRSLISILVL